MKYVYRLLVGLFMLFLFTACSSADDTGNTETHSEHETLASSEHGSEVGKQKESELETNDQSTEETTDDEPTYQEETMPTDYLFHGEYISSENNTPGILTLDFTRIEENGSLEEDMKKSLVESDETSQNVLSELEDVTIENGTEATFTFSPDETMASMSSTEQEHFSEMLSQISFLYGIKQLHFYVEDEAGVSIGQSGDIETLEVEANENRGYYLFPTDDSENPEYNYITAATAGEEITDENGDLFDLAATIEAMRMVNTDNVAREPSIDERVEIHSAKVEGKQAEVSYSIADDQEEWTEEDQEQLEDVLQLTALDFEVDALQLTNEDEKTLTTFPFSR